MSADEWNARYRPGQRVRVAMLGPRGEGFLSRTKGPARERGGIAVLEVEGLKGVYSLDFVTPIEAEP